MNLSYAIKNLRSLRQTPYIEIRPITILVGKNSVGKSTYLRSLPLIRQSLETKSSAPVLWYGDYVDFGNFRSSVFENNIKNEIEFSFKIENYTSRNRGRRIATQGFAFQRRNQFSLNINELIVKYGISARGEETKRSYLKLDVLRR